MAFSNTNLSLRRMNIVGTIGDAASEATIGPVKYKYGYVTTDAAATVEASGYFDAATALNQGDVIESVMAIAGTPVLKHYVVTANNLASAGHIIIALQTATSG